LLIFFHEFIPSFFYQIANIKDYLNFFEMDSTSCTAYKFRVSKKNIGGIDYVK
jgi:hypothetical protein